MLKDFIVSLALKSEDLARGVEPDSCFYIQNVERILGKKLDITTDPPPDLAIEVDITSSSRRRFGIYLQLQIPEVWPEDDNGVIRSLRQWISKNAQLNQSTA